jgi:hypothetical protein
MAGWLGRRGRLTHTSPAASQTTTAATHRDSHSTVLVCSVRDVDERWFRAILHMSECWPAHHRKGETNSGLALRGVQKEVVKWGKPEPGQICAPPKQIERCNPQSRPFSWSEPKCGNMGDSRKWWLDLPLPNALCPQGRGGGMKYPAVCNRRPPQ